MNKQDFFARFLDKTALQPQGFARAYAPANIALVKYWGKRDKVLNLPCNSSLSLSLGDLGTETEIFPSDRDTFSLNGESLPEDHPVFRKTFAFVDLFRQGLHQPLSIRSRNTIPTAAGLASSASGFAALTQALCTYWQLDLPESLRSCLARMGSGSACRSFWQGFVAWQCGLENDGSDSFAAPLPVVWPEIRIGILEIDTRHKAISSSAGMEHTRKSSPLFALWSQTAEIDFLAAKLAIAEKDFPRLGQIAQGNALAMHATMMAARPALFYLQPQSFSQIAHILALQKEGWEVYCTADAGANLKLLFLESLENPLREIFPELRIVAPFAPLSSS